MVERIIELARECMETPFRHQGRMCGVALDCAGLIAHVLHGLELPVNDSKGYSRNPHDGQLEAILAAEPSLQLIPKSETRPGDIWACRIKKDPQHLMIYTGKNVIHAYAQTGRVVEQNADAWRKHVTHVYRIVQ